MNRFDIAKMQGAPDTYAPPVNGEVPRDLEGKPLVLDKPIYYCAVIESKSGQYEHRAYVYPEVRLVKRSTRILAVILDGRDSRDDGRVLCYNVEGPEVCTTKENWDTLVRNLCDKEKQISTNKIRQMLKELSILMDEESRYDRMAESWTILEPLFREENKEEDLPF